PRQILRLKAAAGQSSGSIHRTGRWRLHPHQPRPSRMRPHRCPPTLPRDIILRSARAAGKEIEIHTDVCEGAVSALQSGAQVEHDDKVRCALVALAPQVDVVVLAQASMARATSSLPPGTVTVPVLTSPRSSIQRLSHVLA